MCMNKTRTKVAPGNYPNFIQHLAELIRHKSACLMSDCWLATRPVEKKSYTILNAF